MIQHESWPVWALSVGVVVPLIAVIAFCVCGCKKTVPKNELLGLAGMVKITNPEESLNHNHQSDESKTCNAVGSGRACVDVVDNNRRASSTVNRSLPAIPNDPERVILEGGDPIWEEANGDTSSELYATVEDNKHVVQPLIQQHTVSGALKRVSALSSQPNESKNSSTDDGLNFYACVKAEHPYDKLKKSEHPYAQVKSSKLVSGDSVLNEPGTSQTSLRTDEVGDAGCSSMAAGSSSEATPGSGNPIPPPRTRKSNSHSSLLAAAAATQLPGSVPDIPAATAIAGHISANQELPYMTPPILPSTNFSGDSQDSKGYTSISVREPLANIKAQTKASNQRSRAQELVDSHYATVSDDSDEMYAAIEEPNQVYTSGSETYAQIQPTPLPEVQSLPVSVPMVEPYFPPQPPSVDSLKHVAQAHSRQASSSSATSSVANLGSPKPEKRQANSPLPPPPSGSPELYSSVDKKCLLHPSEAAGTLNLEEMYAKVLKKKDRNVESDTIEDVLSGAAPNSDSVSHVSLETSASRECVSMRTRREQDRVSLSSSEFVQDMKVDSSSYDNSPIQSSDDLYCGYEQLHNSDTKQSREFLMSDSDYESVTAHSVKYDPGYEVVQQRRKIMSEGEPNYEELHPQHVHVPTVSASVVNSNDETVLNQENCSIAITKRYTGYETVHSNSRTSITSNDTSKEGDTVFSGDCSEPNYESMPSEGPEHNYAGILGAVGGSESDPNYEMVDHEDPNYESVNYFEANSDPPYERLQNDNDTIPGYEQVKLQGVALGYETVINGPIEKPQREKQNIEPGYEEIGKKQEGLGVDVWEGSKHSIYNTSSERSNSSSVFQETEQTEEQLCSGTKLTDTLYSQVHKKSL